MKIYTTFTFLIGTVIWASSERIVASKISSEIEYGSPASPFTHYLSLRSGGAVSCGRHSRVCRRRGGRCVEDGTCDTNHMKGVFCSRSGKCTCCAKNMANICNPRKSCTDEGGFCIVNRNACRGGKFIKGGCKCKSWNGRGHCCVPPAPHWSYSGDHGPDSWGTLYSTCAGNAQSPIETTMSDLESVATGYPYSDDPWVFSGYDVAPLSIDIKNNGHSASITWNGASTATVSGGLLGAEYTLAGFHFHWGADNTVGSEHIIDTQDPIELHLVHYKTEYGGVAESLSHADGLAVLGILYEVDTALNPSLTPITDALADVIEPGSVNPDISFSGGLETLLPTNTENFMRYQGSLTTPTCNEVVTWTVFTTKSTISEAQLNAFRAMKFDDGTQMVDNFRPVLPLNGRELKYISS